MLLLNLCFSVYLSFSKFISSLSLIFLISMYQKFSHTILLFILYYPPSIHHTTYYPPCLAIMPKSHTKNESMYKIHLHFIKKRFMCMFCIFFSISFLFLWLFLGSWWVLLFYLFSFYSILLGVLCD